MITVFFLFVPMKTVNRSFIFKKFTSNNCFQKQSCKFCEQTSQLNSILILSIGMKAEITENYISKQQNLKQNCLHSIISLKLSRKKSSWVGVGVGMGRLN